MKKSRVLRVILLAFLALGAGVGAQELRERPPELPAELSAGSGPSSGDDAAAGAGTSSDGAGSDGAGSDGRAAERREAGPEEDEGELWELPIDLDGAGSPRAQVISIDAPANLSAGRGRISGYAVGSVDWAYEYKGEPVRIRADLLVVHADIASGLAAGEADTADDADAADGDAADGDRKKKEDDPSVRFRFERYTVYASGRVRVDLPLQKTHIEADELLFEHPSGVGVARGARLMSTINRAVGLPSVIESKVGRSPADDADPRSLDQPILQAPLVVRADVLRFLGFRYFRGDDVRLSNSPMRDPLIALDCESLEIYPVELTAAQLGLARQRLPSIEEGTQPSASDTDDASGADGAGDLVRWGDALGGDEGRSEGSIINPESTWISVLGMPTAPLPIGYWDTRWNDFLPVRSLAVGSSGAYGPYVGADWNINFFLRLLPIEDIPVLREIDSNARLGFDTNYYNKRGFGYGPNAEYGTSPSSWDPWQIEQYRWSYAGEARYFGITDQGDKDRTTGRPVPREDRYWGTLIHRQSIPWVGTLDLEYSDLSDSAFLGEYFERIEKEQETLAYLRRNFRDNLTLTGLFKVRTNDFQTQTERLPEATFRAFQQPVFDTGLYTDLDLAAAVLRLRPDDDLGEPDRRLQRYDLTNQWSYPVQWFSPLVDVLPFGFGRYTWYEELADPTVSSEDRLTFGAGVTASQQWSRVFAMEDDSFATRVLSIERLKHIMVPRVTYRNVFSNDLSPDELIPIDEVDTVDREESFTLSFRNELHARELVRSRRRVKPLVDDRDVELESARYRTRRILDSNLSFVLYPRRSRDNGGDRSSFIRFDNTIRARRASLRAWMELDPNDGLQLERLDLSTSVDVFPEQLQIILGDRYTRPQTHLIYGDLRLWMSDKWALNAYYSRDIERQRDVEIRLGLTRVFERWAATFEYVLDVGEDYNSTFNFGFMPIEMFRLDLFR